MKLKIALNNRYLIKPWTYVLDVVLIFYLFSYSAICWPLCPRGCPKVAKSQIGQQNGHPNSHHSKDITTNSKDESQNHWKATKTTNHVSFVDSFVSRELESLMNDSNTANTAIKTSESTYDGEICPIDRRLEERGVHDELDELVVKFENVASRDDEKGENLRVGLAEAINLEEIIEDHHRLKNNNLFGKINEKSSSENHKKISPSKGLLDLLDGIDTKIVHRKVLGGKAVEKLIAFALNQPKYYDKVILSVMFTAALTNTFEENKRQQVQKSINVDKLSDNPDLNPVVTKSMSSESSSTTSSRINNRTKTRKIVKVLGTAFSLAIIVFEELYLSPSFLEHLPIIGAGVRKLKKFGQSPYDIIQAVRSVHEFLNHYKEAQGDDPILKIAYIMNKNSPMMLSQRGIDSLGRIATKLVESNRKGRMMTLEDKKEIAGRSAFYFLINFAKKLGGCRLTQKTLDIN